MTREAACVVGADGCQGGAGDAWAAVRLFADGRAKSEYFGSTLELWRSCQNAALILLDVPIGLPDEGARLADAMARDMIGPRRSSVFPAPERWLIECPTIEQADEERARRAGRRVKVQRQMWNIVPRIRAVDQLLRREARAREVVREVHPEVCAASLAGGVMLHYKKEREGEEERLAVIERYLPGARHEMQKLRSFRGVAVDDAIDALLCAVTAAAVFTDPSRLRTLPAQPARDSCGLPMEMVYRVG